MVMGFFKGSRNFDINDLILHKQYDRAAQLISKALGANKKNERLRLQLAHVLTLAGERNDAIAVLDTLADDLARDGFVTKAIAVLKKIQRLDPGRSGIDERLARLIDEGPSAAGGTWMNTGPQPEIAIDLGEPAPVLVSDSGALVPPPEKPAEAASGAGAPGEGGALGTPLFRGMSQAEIAAVIRGLNLLSFSPGAILVTEGEPGDSLFILTTGLCRAYVRNADSKNVEVRQLKEGDFFGEISVLSGRARTATITAATPCELLELDRASLDSILETHPNVRNVLEEFFMKRADSSLESDARGRAQGE
jgi:cAMP-dependent protein kinase regulator